MIDIHYLCNMISRVFKDDNRNKRMMDQSSMVSLRPVGTINIEPSRTVDNLLVEV